MRRMKVPVRYAYARELARRSGSDSTSASPHLHRPPLAHLILEPGPIAGPVYRSTSTRHCSRQCARGTVQYSRVERPTPHAPFPIFSPKSCYGGESEPSISRPDEREPDGMDQTDPPGPSWRTLPASIDRRLSSSSHPWLISIIIIKQNGYITRDDVDSAPYIKDVIFN